MYVYAYHVCMCMSAYVYRVCMSISTQIVCVCMPTMYVYVCVCMRTPYAYVCIHHSVCLRMYASGCMRMCAVCMCVCLHAYAYVRRHTTPNVCDIQVHTTGATCIGV